MSTLLHLAQHHLEQPAAAPDPIPIEAVILAAGRGSRLGAVTQDRPKCLVDVGGTPLLEHQLDALARVGVDDVTIVAGYRAADIRAAIGDRARFVANDDWPTTNSLYSIALCDGTVQGDLLVMNCDVLVHPLAMHRLLEASGSAFLYDSSSGDADEHMKVELRGGRLVAMSKALPASRSNGENVGILRFAAGAVPWLFHHAGELLAAGRLDAWLASAVERLARTTPIRGVDIADLPWIEIDFPDDLEQARRRVWPRVSHALVPSLPLAA